MSFIKVRPEKPEIDEKILQEGLALVTGANFSDLVAMRKTRSVEEVPFLHVPAHPVPILYLLLVPFAVMVLFFLVLFRKRF